MSALTDYIDLELKRRRIQIIDFAAEVGITPQSYYKWRRGEGNPKLANIKKIASILDVPTSTLLDIQDGILQPETEKAATPEDDGNEKRVDYSTLSKSPNLIQNTIIKPGLGNMKNFHKLIHHCPYTLRILFVDRIRKLCAAVVGNRGFGFGFGCWRIGVVRVFRICRLWFPLHLI